MEANQSIAAYGIAKRAIASAQALVNNIPKKRKGVERAIKKAERLVAEKKPREAFTVLFISINS